MRKKILNTLAVCLILLLASCREEEEFSKQANSSTTTNQHASKVSLGEYESEMPYNLNVIYFIPSDGIARPEYERRVSEILLSAQDYFRTNMYNWGFGNKTFGLLKNPATNRIKINVIHGSKPMSSYNDSDGQATNMIHNEVVAYFASHPTDKTSNHTIIFIATPSPQTPIPYNGFYLPQSTGAVVGDNEAFDLQYINEGSPRGNQAKSSMGGFLHELGHGLNLPHTALPKSQTNIPGYGTSLMGAGNYTYGFSSTILAKTSCAILNNCQVFSTSAKPAGYFYAPGKEFKITSINANYSNGRINISGTYTANAPLNAIISYYVPAQNNYYAPSGIASYTSNTFSTYIDLADLYHTDKDYVFALEAAFEDGSIADAQYYNFTFVNGVPDIKWDMNRDSWTVSSSSQHLYYPAIYAIDGNVNTYWHTNYELGTVQTGPANGLPQNFPYYFDIDMGSVNSISGLSFIQHQGLVRTAKNISISTRSSASDTWKVQNSYTLTNVTSKQYTAFPQVDNARYIRIKFDSSYDGQPYVAIPEIGAY